VASARPPQDPGRTRVERRGLWLKRLASGFHIGTAALATAWLALIALLVGVLLYQARFEIHRAGFAFLWGTDWDPVRNVYGALPFVFGTVLTSAIALAIAVPLGLGTAIFLSQLAPTRLRVPLSHAVDLLAAVPSIVYGLWAVFVLVPLMGVTVEPALGAATGHSLLFSGTPQGTDVLTASVVLAIMILPTISAISREAMQAVPRVQREVALSLGATRWEATRLAILRPARSGILGGILLGLGRAVGETIAVTMTIGNNPQVTHSLFAQGQTIASLIANDLTSAGPPETSALVEVGLILLGITFLINIIARVFIHRIRTAGERDAADLSVAGTSSPRRIFEASPHHLGPTRPSLEGKGAGRPAWRVRVERDFPARLRRRQAGYVVLAGLTILCTILALLPLISIVATAVDRGGAAVIQPTFYTEGLAPGCNPAVEQGCQLGGIGPALSGTLILIGLASLIAVPLGIFVGVYLSEYGRNRFARTVSFLTEVMTGLPSILIGMFVFILFLSADHNIVASAITGAIALSVLMLPMVIRTTEEALKSVPPGVREAALALGFPRHWVTLRVTLGCARAGIVTGAVLAAARAGGETAALIMTAQGFQYYPEGLDKPIGALSLTIFDFGTQSYPNWQEAAWGATLILLVLMLAIGLATRLIFHRQAIAAEVG
jgi:phosphate transport system permease protein